MNHIIIPVAHDYICPWCWIGFLQAKRLKSEEHIEIDWQGFELFPANLEWPERHLDPIPENRPPTPSRFQFLLEIEGISLPEVDKPHHMRTHQAHLATEFAKSKGKGLEFVEAMYKAYWLDGKNINSPDVFVPIGKSVGLDEKELIQSVMKEQYAENIVGFDDPAHELGVYNVPTFFIGDERIAEQSYAKIVAAIARFRTATNQAPYADFGWPEEANVRSYVILETASTLDGKLTLNANPGSAISVGSAVDHQAMRNLIATCDAVVMGASTARAALGTWAPPKPRFILTRHGNFDFNHTLFQDNLTTLVMGSPGNDDLPGKVSVWKYQNADSIVSELLAELQRRELKKIVLLGGGETNSLFLRSNRVDELVLTIAPKIAGGHNLPTVVDGEPLNWGLNEQFELVHSIRIQNELFLRYRRLKS